MAADFNAGILTDKGKALLVKWHEGLCVPKLTRAAAGAGSYTSGEDLNGRTALKDERMSIEFSHIETQNETTVALRFTLTNEDLKEGFTITEIGVFATDPDEGEILYSIATTADESNADYMPAYNGEYPTTIIFNYQIEVANAANVTIVAGSTGMYALAADLEVAEVKIGNLETATADLEEQIEDAVKELEDEIVVKVEEAQEAADQAQSAAEAAQSTADQAVKDAASAQSTADAAQSTANQAVTNAANAQETADSANTAAATAQSTADAAQSTADQAVSDASAAQSAADAAQKSAEAAQSTADQAVKDAASAQSTADTAKSGLTDGSVTKVGTSTVGGAAKPIYLSSGTPTACSSTVGSGTVPTYLSSGTVTASTSTVGSGTQPAYLSSGTITACGTTVGSSTKPIYSNSGVLTACSSTVGSGTKPIYSSSGTLTASSSTVGSSTKPVYLNSGTITACSLYPTSTFSLSTGSWSSNTSGDYNYRYQLSNSSVTADTIALAFLDTSCASVAGDAGMCSVVESSSGTLTFRAVDIPTAAITGSVVLLNT